MADDRVYDAVNVYKYSPTGKRQTRTGGDGAYQQRYWTLALHVQTKLWELWNADEIGWHDTGQGVYGVACRRPGHNIRITHHFEPTSRADFLNADNQARLAASCAIMVHEAVHLVEDRKYVEEEIVCRHLQVQVFIDLLAGIQYNSRVCGQQCTARLAPIGPHLKAYIDEYNTVRIPAYRNGRMVDMVVGIDEYRSSLDADFVIRSFDWWGGIANRQPKTRGYYLNVLAAEGRNARFDLIMRILTSFRGRAEWAQAQGVIRMEALRNALVLPLYSARNYARIAAVQHALGVNLGVR